MKRSLVMRGFRRRLGDARPRRGVEAIEFAMILPLFMAMIFASMEFSWYMFQRAGVVDAARVACRQAAQLDPDLDNVVAIAGAVIIDELRDVLIDCGATGVSCVVNIQDLANSEPARVTCDVQVTFKTLTGFLGQSGDGGSASGMGVGSYRWSGVGLLPDNIHGVSTAVYEGVP